ncbi:3-oxoacyl-ACP reductase FabG [Actinocrinis puniceicyclus]|uniref:3-oxoacyl-ACP reductase FabG n=1 Tax=Actinocrinis puniceicyclus TaxID=977794 RepID=A0A8J7WQZ1_9ACTN|nr:3-oxoacyl-ACP reductase FabG [Actinocrinis puniceicyclus]MBS2965105.1 3-oxoacyl-ACP reductase FabG [Actinocrinis puniceicyclus]
MSRFEDRVAIVTGAAQGIGAAIARRLAGEGAAVAVLDLTAERAQDTVDQIAKDGGRAVAVGADVSKSTDVQAAVAAVAGQYGHIDILVNNAGITRDNLLFKMTDEDWDTVIAVNLRSAFLMSRECQKHFVAQKYGKIVSLSSRSALGNRGQANYSASKAAIMGLTATLAIELGPFGINVNAVAPGFIATDMTDATARRVGFDPAAFREAAAQATPVRRVGTPEDIAAAVAFLAADESSFISGQTLHVNGGADR